MQARTCVPRTDKSMDSQRTENGPAPMLALHQLMLPSPCTTAAQQSRRPRLNQPPTKLTHHVATRTTRRGRLGRSRRRLWVTAARARGGEAGLAQGASAEPSGRRSSAAEARARVRGLRLIAQQSPARTWRALSVPGACQRCRFDFSMLKRRIADLVLSVVCSALNRVVCSTDMREACFWSTGF